MPSTSSTTPVLSSSGVSQPDNAGVTAKESDTDRVLLSMKFCFSAPPLTLFTLQWAYTMLLSPPPSKNSGSDPVAPPIVETRNSSSIVGAIKSWN